MAMHVIPALTQHYMYTDRFNDWPKHHIKGTKYLNGVVPDCSDSEWQQVLFSDESCIVLVETTNESVLYCSVRSFQSITVKRLPPSQPKAPRY